MTSLQNTINAAEESLKSLDSLRRSIVTQLLQEVAPKMDRVTTQSKDEKMLAWVFTKANGLNDPQELAFSELPPIYGINESGILFNGCGNVATKRWATIAVQDLVKLSNRVLELLAKDQKAPACA